MEPDSAVIRHRDALEVHWPPGTVSNLPYLWLRDNCRCEECRVVQTSEKRFMISDVPDDIAPLAVSLQGDTLILAWPDSHETSYIGSDIEALHKQGVQGWSSWCNDFVPARCPFPAFLDDDAIAASAIADFLDKGAFILEHAPTQSGTLELLAPRLGPIREVLFARIHDVQVDARGYNVAHTSIELPPHNDFASYTWPPSVQALHMLVNEAGGGESIIVDGWHVLTQLRDEHPQHFQALCDMPVPFREFDDDNETYAVAPVVRCDVDGNIVSLRFSNQLMQTLDPETPGIGDFYRACHALCGMVTDDAFKAKFRLEHCLQTATRAERDGADDETIVCALLHDIGDVLAPSNHSAVAADLLAPFVSEKNEWIVRHHGLFQGYYYFHHCGKDRDARDKYRGHEYYQACADFCACWDQASFDPDYDTLPLEHFESRVHALFASEPKPYV